MRVGLWLCGLILTLGSASAQPPPEAVWEITVPTVRLAYPVALSSDGALIALGLGEGGLDESEGSIEVRATGTGALIHSIETIGEERLAPVPLVTFRPGTNHLVTTSWYELCNHGGCEIRDFGIQEWSLTDGSLVRQEPWPNIWYELVGAFDASGSRFAARWLHASKPVSFVDWASLDTVLTMPDDSKGIRDLSFEGENVWTYGRHESTNPSEWGYYARKWDGNTGALTASYDHIVSYEPPDVCDFAASDSDPEPACAATPGRAARSPDGRLLATSSGHIGWNAYIDPDDVARWAYTRIWDLESGAVLHQIPVYHFQGMSSFHPYLAFTPDNRHLMVANGWTSENGRRTHVAFIDVQTGEAAAAFTLSGEVSWVAIPPQLDDVFLVYAQRSEGFGYTLGLYRSGLSTGTGGEIPGDEAMQWTALSPNPAGSQTTGRLIVTESGPIRVGLYDLLGREVQRFVDGTVNRGAIPITIDASVLPSGVYVLRAVDGTGRMITQKLSVVR